MGKLDEEYREATMKNMTIEEREWKTKRKKQIWEN